MGKFKVKELKTEANVCEEAHTQEITPLQTNKSS